MPQFWIVAGPNGAGKTTLADRYLAPRIPVVSPDAIALASQVTPFQAGRMAVAEQDRLLSEKASFAIDTTFSGNRELALIQRAADAGYKTNLIYVGIASVGLCLARIRERVDSGGHDVPGADIARRFGRSLKNLALSFDLADRIFVFDNTGEKRRLLLSVERNTVKHRSRNLPEWAMAAVTGHLSRPAQTPRSR